MTFYRKDPNDISNWHDLVLEGIGHRGSSFTDVDRWMVVHDGVNGPRFLFMEFKYPDEMLSPGQAWMLRELALQPNTTVWIVTMDADEQGVTLQEFTQEGQGLFITQELSVDAYRQRFADWWNRTGPRGEQSVGICWAEYVKQDPSLQAFLDATFARERIAIQTAADERDHWRSVAEALWIKLHPKDRERLVKV